MYFFAIIRPYSKILVRMFLKVKKILVRLSTSDVPFKQAVLRSKHWFVAMLGCKVVIGAI